MTTALLSTVVRKQNFYHPMQILLAAKGFSTPPLWTPLIYYKPVSHCQLLEMPLNLPFRAALFCNSKLL